MDEIAYTPVEERQVPLWPPPPRTDVECSECGSVVTLAGREKHTTYHARIEECVLHPLHMIGPDGITHSD